MSRSTSRHVPFDELGKLVDQVSSVVYWLRQKQPQSAGNLLIVDVSNDQQAEDVANSLRQLIQAIEYNNNNLTNAQMRYIFSCYDAKIWGKSLVKVVCEAYPRFIDVDVCQEIVELTQAFLEHGTDEDPVESLMKELVKALDKLGRSAFHGLGELCALIRDCSGDPSKIAADLGPRILMTKMPTPASINAASYLFQVLVNRSEDMFGQSGSSVLSLDAFGVRKKNRTQAEGENRFWDLDLLMPAIYKQKKDLKTFYSHIDPKYVPIVDELFKYHAFQEIAFGIYRKYKMIPAPWKSELQKLKQSGEKLDWFNYERIETPKPGSKGTPVNIERSPSIPTGTRNEVDLCIDTFIDTEVIYYRQMKTLGKQYVSKLNEIALGRSAGQMEAAMALGLSVGDVDKLFGAAWQQVMDFVHQLLVMLETVSLIRTNPMSPYTREGVFADILSSLFPDRIYYAYMNFFGSYATNMKLLESAIVNTTNVKSKKGLPNFVDMWEKVSRENFILANFQLKDVVSLPMGRIGNYREMLNRLCDAAQNGGNNTSLAKLGDAYRRFRQAEDGLKQIYLAVR